MNIFLTKYIDTPAAASNVNIQFLTVNSFFVTFVIPSQGSSRLNFILFELVDSSGNLIYTDFWVPTTRQLHLSRLHSITTYSLNILAANVYGRSMDAITYITTPSFCECSTVNFVVFLHTLKH